MNTNEEIIIKVEDLYFTYADGTKALNGINLEITKGKKVALLGANGSGKSTFFLCLNGINKPSNGQLFLHGKAYDYGKKGLLDIRTKIGIVFQDPDNQLFSANVYQEISFGALNIGLSREEAAARVEQAIEDLEITEFRDKPTHFLSGGQKKQVSIADILVMNPEVIVLDEPAAALDPKHTAIVNELVDKLSDRGITILIATHDVDYAYNWADEVILFHKGTVLAQGSPELVFLDNAVLEKTNLKKPAALRLFEDLTKSGFLPAGLSLPRNLETLEQYIYLQGRANNE
ncbi:MAG: ATP-binding cassette domain-containing protein [Bacillota bacterium]|nr:ATP-binding cassette domain-containing protein [Bacillota bacterium]